MINETTHVTGQAASHQSPIQERSQMGKEEFLRLLVTQLSNQDPLNPMDGQEFAAQLAQFSSVEQLLNIQQTLVEAGELNGMLAQGINSGVASGLIGREVEAETSTIHWDGGATSSARLELAQPAASVTVNILDESGAIVRTLELENLGSGTHDIDWNGRDHRGASVPKGFYRMEIAAADAGGNAIPARALATGRVDRVTFGQDGIKIWIGDLPVSMSHVKAVSS